MTEEAVQLDPIDIMLPICTKEQISFVEAAKGVVDVMMQMLEAREGEVSEKPLEPFPHVARSRIELKCKSPRILTIFFQEGVPEAFAKKLFMTTDDLPREDIDDSLGELANMFAGNAKTVLADLLKEHIGLGLPRVLWEEEIPYRWIDWPDTLFVPFETDLGNFAIFIRHGYLKDPDDS